MVVFGQGSVGQGVVVQVVGETEGQFGGGVEIQQVVLAGALLHQALAGLADVLHQFRLVGLDAFGQARGVGVGGRPFANRREQPGKLRQAGRQDLQDILRAAPAQAFEQAVEAVEATGHDHEFVVQANQPAAAQAHVRILEGARRAHRPHGLGDEARAELAEALAVEAALQAFGGEPGEVAEAPVECVAQGGAAGLRQEDGADGTGAEDAQGYFQDPPQRRHEGAFRVRSGWNPDHGRGVAGEYAGVAAEIAVARGAGGAQADPERQAGEEQHTLLGEQGDQSDHHAEADQGSDDAVEALGQDLPALRLHDDEDRHQHRAWLRQLQAIGQPQGEAGGEQGLEHEDPGDAVATRPFEQGAAQFVGAGKEREGSRWNQGETFPGGAGHCCES